MVELHIGKSRTSFRVPGTGTQPDITHAAAVGFRGTAAAYFLHSPPTPGEMERAIEAVEDVVMPLHLLVSPADGPLVTSDASIGHIAQLAGVAGGAEMKLGLGELERVFNRLASVVVGSPAASAGIPEGPDFAATLLILRECLHHLDFDSITFRAVDAEGGNEGATT
ncbi:MAG: hypothetical protein ABIR26_18580 [Ramlibacter sp.]